MRLDSSWEYKFSMKAWGYHRNLWIFPRLYVNCSPVISKIDLPKKLKNDSLAQSENHSYVAIESLYFSISWTCTLLKSWVTIPRLCKNHSFLGGNRSNIGIFFSYSEKYTDLFFVTNHSFYCLQKYDPCAKTQTYAEIKAEVCKIYQSKINHCSQW